MTESVPVTLAQPTLVLGISSLTSWLSSQRLRSLLVLVDAELAASRVTELVQLAAARSGCATTRESLTAPTSLIRLSALATRVQGFDGIVGIGGGSVLDQVKLASALAADPPVRARLGHRQRAGWVTLPDTIACPDRPRVVAVPTTVGTGTELSSVACLDAPDGKRLVAGAGLLPDVAVLDSEATRSLPSQLVMEGVFEALSRVIGPYAGSHQDLPFEDGLAETVAARLATLGHDLHRQQLTGAPATDVTRLQLARLSGFSHSSWLALGRVPYAYKAWFLATELSHVADCRKVPALTALLPPVWRRIIAGCAPLGSAARLQRIWQAVAATAPQWLPADPAAGIAALAQRWGLPVRLRFDPAELVRRAQRRWGAGLPMLAGIDAQLLRDIADAAASEADAAASPAAGAAASDAGASVSESDGRSAVITPDVPAMAATPGGAGYDGTSC